MNCRKEFRDKNSMIRHIQQKHSCLFSADRPEVQELVMPNRAPMQNRARSPSTSTADHDEASDMNEVAYHDEAGFDFNAESSDLHAEPINMEDELKRLAVKVLLDLRSTSSLTGKAIERFESGCYNMLKQYSASVCQNVRCALEEKGMGLEEIREVLKSIEVKQDPFDKLKTIEDQLQYFKERYGLVIPESKFLGTRVDQRLDPKSNSFVSTIVTETFQYISIIETLKTLLSNKSFREQVFQERASTDDVLRSYVDGSHCKSHPYLQRHKNVLHILLFFDELEIANALGSKTIIHKLAAFFFQILNLPPEVSSKLSSIHLLALAFADDLKKEGAMDKVLTLLVLEMKKLSSEEGVQCEINGEVCILRAILVAVTADSLAAHDVLGFISTSARHFCRRCMVSRPEIRSCANAVGVTRTIEMHQGHVAEVTRQPNFRTQCGVKRSCILDNIPYFNCIDNNVFDIFHDLLEGVVPLVIKCVVGHYVKKKLFTSKEFNSKVSSFSYGVPDSRNKPSPNFTEHMFLGSARLSQNGTQYWCLIRTLPFLLGDFVKDHDEYMELIFLLQDALQIIFAFEVRPEDLDRLDSLIFKHHELFQKLFIDKNINQEIAPDDDFRESEEVDDVQGEDEDLAGDIQVREEQGETSGQRKGVKPPPKVYVTNKFHHMKHLPEMMSRFGPAIRMWCAKFEGRMKIFRQHSAICCNFRNPPKTMAQMFQLSNLKSIITEDGGFSVDFQKSGQNVVVKLSIHCESLLGAGLKENEIVHYTNSATLNGEDYRPGLFVTLPESTITRPNFAFISDVIVAEKALLLVVKPWANVGLSPKFNAFQVKPMPFCENLIINVLSLHNYRCIAPWTVGSKMRYSTPIGDTMTAKGKDVPNIMHPTGILVFVFWLLFGLCQFQSVSVLLGSSDVEGS
ncbi:Filamin A-interacting protein 1-like [Frankliniella fusca]|uniref:Filamin A-interacting protein 1-like n=1 Tax=Frankliniella fusca TaxID=407009 RepID=A0AAE1HBB5_9NEOP|nr:Filamin A-interacting protein 1-like [Frankliniella fusca]